MFKAIAASAALVIAGLGVYAVAPTSTAHAQGASAESTWTAPLQTEGTNASFQVAQQNSDTKHHHQLELSAEMKALRTELWMKFPDTISGMWIENDPGDADHGRVYVSATSDDVLSFVKSKDASIRVERARFSHKELVAKKKEIEERLKTVGVGEGSYVEVDEDDNEVRVYLGDRNKPRPGTDTPIDLAEHRRVKVELESQGEIVDVSDDRFDDTFSDDDFDDDWDDDFRAPEPPPAPVAPEAQAPQQPAEPAPAEAAPAAPAEQAPAAPAPAAPAQQAPAKPAKPAKQKPAKPAKQKPAKPAKQKPAPRQRWDDDDDDDDRYDRDDRDDDDD